MECFYKVFVLALSVLTVQCLNEDQNLENGADKYYGDRSLTERAEVQNYEDVQESMGGYEYDDRDTLHTKRFVAGSLDRFKLLDRNDIVKATVLKSRRIFKKVKNVAQFLGKKIKKFFDKRWEKFDKKVDDAAEATKKLTAEEAEIIENSTNQKAKSRGR